MSKRPISWQKRPISVSKEPYFCVKRDLLLSSLVTARHVHMAKGPIVAKETYFIANDYLFHCILQGVVAAGARSGGQVSALLPPARVSRKLSFGRVAQECVVCNAIGLFLLRDRSLLLYNRSLCNRSLFAT